MFRKTLAAAALSLVFSANVQAAPLSFQSKTLEAKSCDGKNSEGKPLCHQLTVGYPITGDKHLDNWVRKQMGGQTADTEIGSDGLNARQRRKGNQSGKPTTP